MMRTVLLSLLLSGCTLLSSNGVHEAVQATIIGHNRTDIPRHCQWAGVATEFKTDFGAIDSLCGNYGEVGDRVQLVWSSGFVDKGRNGLHRYNEEVLNGQGNCSGPSVAGLCLGSNSDSH